MLVSNLNANECHISMPSNCFQIMFYLMFQPFFSCSVPFFFSSGHRLNVFHFVWLYLSIYLFLYRIFLGRKKNACKRKAWPKQNRRHNCTCLLFCNFEGKKASAAGLVRSAFYQHIHFSNERKRTIYNE